jgi:hypothetical protein
VIDDRTARSLHSNFVERLIERQVEDVVDRVTRALVALIEAVRDVENRQCEAANFAMLFEDVEVRAQRLVGVRG